MKIPESPLDLFLPCEDIAIGCLSVNQHPYQELGPHITLISRTVKNQCLLPKPSNLCYFVTAVKLARQHVSKLMIKFLRLAVVIFGTAPPW
jgi:hypothetical protein